MVKNSFKIKFEHADTKMSLEWKGHPYEATSICDFLNSFVGMLGVGLEVVERKSVAERSRSHKEATTMDYYGMEIDFMCWWALVVDYFRDHHKYTGLLKPEDFKNDFENGIYPETVVSNFLNELNNTNNQKRKNENLHQRKD